MKTLIFMMALIMMSLISCKEPCPRVEVSSSNEIICAVALCEASRASQSSWDGERAENYLKSCVYEKQKEKKCPLQNPVTVEAPIVKDVFLSPGTNLP